MTDRKTVKGWMRANVADFLDPWQEVNATGLTESAAAQFDLYEPDDSIDEDWFDMAADVADWYERSLTR